MRLAALRANMTALNLDAVILTNPVSQHYISRFPFEDGYVVVGREKAAVLADFRYIEVARATVPSDFAVCLLERAHPNILPETLADYGAVRVGYEDRSLTCAGLTAMAEKLPGIELFPIGGMVDDLREFKDSEEVGMIIRAQRIAEKAFEHVLGVISTDITEVELAAELEYAMRRGGSEGPAFSTIAISGASTSLPHGVPQDRKLVPGFITMDYGATIGGYRSDMTRTVVLGKADDDMKKLYATVLEAQLRSLDAVCEGADRGEVDAVARDIIENAGYHGCFGHGLGHGVGMYIHEAPNLNPSSFGKTLKRGQIVTVEPGIYVEKKYGCRIEDMVALTENGSQDLTECEKQLIEL